VSFIERSGCEVIVIVMLAVLSLLLFFCALQMEVYPDAAESGP